MTYIILYNICTAEHVLEKWTALFLVQWAHEQDSKACLIKSAKEAESHTGDRKVGIIGVTNGDATGGATSQQSNASRASDPLTRNLFSLPLPIIDLAVSGELRVWKKEAGRCAGLGNKRMRTHTGRVRGGEDKKMATVAYLDEIWLELLLPPLQFRLLQGSPSRKNKTIWL